MMGVHAVCMSPAYAMSLIAIFLPYELQTSAC